MVIFFFLYAFFWVFFVYLFSFFVSTSAFLVLPVFKFGFGFLFCFVFPSSAPLNNNNPRFVWVRAEGQGPGELTHVISLSRPMTAGGGAEELTYVVRPHETRLLRKAGSGGKCEKLLKYTNDKISYEMAIEKHQCQLSNKIHSKCNKHSYNLSWR